LTVLKSDSSTWGFPKGSPDFGLFECSSSTAIASGAKRVLWRQTGGFCEVKPTLQQGPKSKDPKVVKPVVCQAADYARLHLSARPFQLFSVGLLIFGSEFCVAIFDRTGVLFSPIHDMWEDTEIFIRVIRSLTCHLSSVELGQDPTVTTLPYQQHEIWRNQTKDLGRQAPKDFPTFVITMGGPGSPSWYTIGLPIWTSVSLLGRGTSVWLVRENGAGPVLVLKNTWRSASRVSESMIYGSIHGDHPALAKLHQGHDVLFPGEQQRYITARNLRSPAVGGKIDGGDIFLHRLLLKSRGRPLWEYRSEKELLQGIRAALSGTCPSYYRSLL
jgi:Fungal protein kinase